MKEKKFIAVFARNFSTNPDRPNEVYHLAEVEPSGTVVLYCAGKIPIREGWRRGFLQSDPTVEDFAQNNNDFYLCQNCVKKYKRKRML